MIKGNLIGTDVTGSLDLGNSTNGVQILNSASLNTIGGVTLADRNIISGNNGDGILIDTTSPDGNSILGNYIGTDISGTSALANSVYGVFVRSKNNTIGGTAAGAGNLISGNIGGGVGISSSAATGNTVQGNYIGTNAVGTGDLGNIQSGVAIGSGASRSNPSALARSRCRRRPFRIPATCGAGSPRARRGTRDTTTTS